MTRREPYDSIEAERLHRAASDGNIDEMKRLFLEGCGLNVLDDLSRGPLHYAVIGEHYKAAVWLLVQGADVNLHDDERVGETPLCFAAQSLYPEMVELLLQNGADPDIKGWVGQSARSRADKRKDPDGIEIAGLIAKYSKPLNLPVVRKKK